VTKKPKPFVQGMTLMPGESAEASFSFNVPPEVARQLAWRDGDQLGFFQEVPPPDAPIVDPDAEALGLARGLTADINRHSPFRCNSCSEMQPVGAHLIWVPDGLYPNAGADIVFEMCRRNAFNGHRSAWCLKCARTLSPGALRSTIDDYYAKMPEATLIDDETKLPPPWLSWLLLTVLAMIALAMMLI
jgi:hypothetical protein